MNDLRHSQFVHRVTLSAILMLILCIPELAVTALAQCDKCTDRVIYLFDAKVDVPRSAADADSILKWRDLFWPGRIARYWSHMEDPSKDCFVWIDGGAWLAEKFQGDTLTLGDEYANLPPAGTVNGVPYLLTGSVEPSGSGTNQYKFTWQIECGTSREVVKSSTVNFTVDSAGIENAGETAACELMPIASTITAFEIQKRENDPGVARGGEGAYLKVTPSRHSLAPHDTTTVELEMVDCDGYPLKNRVINLGGLTNPTLGSFPGPEGGTVSQNEVTTDDEGRARVVFTAGEDPGIAMVNAVYIFRKPHGWKDALTGSGVINLKPNSWEVNATCRVTDNDFGDTTYTEDGATITDQNYSFEQEYMYCHFVYEMTDLSNMGPHKLVLSAPADESTGGIVHSLSVFATWSYVGTTRWDGTQNDEGYSVSEGTSRNFSGNSSDSSSIMGSSGLNFDYNGTINLIGMSTPVHRVGEDHRWLKTQPQSPIEPEYDTSSDIDDWGPVGCSTNSGDPSASFTQQDSNYSVEYNEVNNIPGVWTETERLFAQITRSFEPAAVLQPDENKLPRNFALRQNYPNPFNPTTTISYKLPAVSYVTLIVYDVLGKKVRTLVNERQSAGTYTVTFDGSGLSSGVYFYRLSAGSYSQSEKLVLIK